MSIAHLYLSKLSVIMLFYTITLLLTLLIPFKASPLVAASKNDGINCNGNHHCHDYKHYPSGLLRDMTYRFISNVPNDLTYHNGEHIACFHKGAFGQGGLNVGGGGVCIYPQYKYEERMDVSVGRIKELLKKLLDHGCTICGSIPLKFNDGEDGGPPMNEPFEGILTSNYVDHPQCKCCELPSMA